MNHGSLFSGIGGFDLASQWCGWKNVFQVEKEPFCQKVLEKNFPHTKRYKDIYEFKGENTKRYRGTIDIISGGFPCQPFSFPGRRKGKEDDRYLWPEMFRVIQEIKPNWVVGENVAGIIGVELDKPIFDLEDVGYEVQAFIIPACAVNAPHRRDRVWIVANTNSFRQYKNKIQRQHNKKNTKEWWAKLNYFFKKPLRYQGTKNAGDDRNNDGISSEVDRVKGLGNAIVPQVACEIFRHIDVVNENVEAKT